MNTQLLISMKSAIEMLIKANEFNSDYANKQKESLNAFERGVSSGIEDTLRSTKFEVKRLEYLINEALKVENLGFLIEDVDLSGTDFEKEVI